MTKTFGIRAAKAHLSELIASARLGADVVITDRGSPVARLSALPAKRLRRTADEVLDELVQEGLVELPSSAKRPVCRATAPRRPVDLGALVRDMRR